MPTSSVSVASVCLAVEALGFISLPIRRPITLAMTSGAANGSLTFNAIGSDLGKINGGAKKNGLSGGIRSSEVIEKVDLGTFRMQERFRELTGKITYWISTNSGTRSSVRFQGALRFSPMALLCSPL
jgi:hypothetical protein